MMYNMVFDEKENLIKLSRMDIIRKLFESSVRFWNTDDLVKGLDESINCLQDQIKIFNKKLAYNKADT